MTPIGQITIGGSIPKVVTSPNLHKVVKRLYAKFHLRDFLDLGPDPRRANQESLNGQISIGGSLPKVDP